MTEGRTARTHMWLCLAAEKRRKCLRRACVHVVCDERFDRFQTHAIYLHPDLTFSWCARMSRSTFTLIAIAATTTSVAYHDDETTWTEGAFTLHVHDHV